ncbi:MAG TPA: hypothetical protein VMU77_00720 [Acidimicrobiales bacterium]|nr:hypothetical protein [Acidimicrobiales bacterium]
MDFHKWTDRSQPQTLQYAVILFYLNSVFAFLTVLGANLGSDISYGYSFIFGLLRLFGITNALGDLALTSGLASTLLTAFSRIIFVGLIAGHVLSGLSIANERKWGYWLGVSMAIIDLAGIGTAVHYGGMSQLFSLYGLLGLIWMVLLVVLLVHPMSREYRRIWFR